MKTLITGGAGFIGSHLTKFCHQAGHEVTVIDNLLTGRKENIQELLDKKLIRFIEADITKYDFTDLGQFDIIFHLASPASPIQYKKHSVETMMTNALGTYRVLEFMQKSGSKRLVFSSTSEVYGDPLVHPQKEDYFGNVNTLGPRSCYDEGKRFAESLIVTYGKKYGLDYRIARIFNTYGPNMEKNDGRVVSNFIVQALQNTPLTIYGDGNQTRSFCYVSDLVEGLYRLGTYDSINGEVINLGNPHEQTMMDLAKIIKQAIGSTSEIVNQSIGLDDPKKRKPDISKAKKLLEWEPVVSFDEGLKHTIEYFKSV